VDKLPAEVFTLVVFVSDGLLRVGDRDLATTAATRFFAISTQLPLELQMVLCYRLMGFMKGIIPSKDSEVAFKELTRRL